jgi:protein SDA1
MMAVLARMIGRHKLILFNFYSYLQKYLFPAQRDVAKLLAYLAEAFKKFVNFLVYMTWYLLKKSKPF